MASAGAGGAGAGAAAGAEAVVRKMFAAADACDWPTLAACFADSVELDFSSMGSPKETVSGNDVRELSATVLYSPCRP